MGWFGKSKDIVRGTARVVSTSAPPHAATHSTLSMDLVIEVDGIPAYANEYRRLVMRVSKWPSPGGVLPVEVERSDPAKVKVLWGEIPTNNKRAKADAEAMAAALRGETAPPGTMPTRHRDAAALAATAGTDIVSQLQQMFPGAMVEMGGTGMSAAAPQAPGGEVRVVAGRSDEDPVARLEKLAKLRDAGVVDAAQFEQLRAQILGQSGL